MGRPNSPVNPSTTLIGRNLGVGRRRGSMSVITSNKFGPVFSFRLLREAGAGLHSAPPSEGWGWIWIIDRPYVARCEISKCETSRQNLPGHIRPQKTRDDKPSHPIGTNTLQLLQKAHHEITKRCGSHTEVQTQKLMLRVLRALVSVTSRRYIEDTIEGEVNE